MQAHAVDGHFFIILRTCVPASPTFCLNPPQSPLQCIAKRPQLYPVSIDVIIDLTKNITKKLAFALVF